MVVSDGVRQWFYAFFVSMRMVTATNANFSINHINTKSYEKKNLIFILIVGLPQHPSSKNIS